MQSAICLLSVVPMRKEPSHRSEMVSQILFGEYVSIEESNDHFVFVTCLNDGYKGWVQANQLTRVPEEQVLATTAYIGTCAEEVWVNGHRRMMPFGVPVYSPEKSGQPLPFGNKQICYRVPDEAIWQSTKQVFSKENLKPVVEIFLETPYLWGGKTIFGIDCSGFVQQVFKLFGVRLLRDAYLQAEQGRAVKNFADAGFGDLAFFQNESERITHVGLLLDDREIVHASGKVRIDPIDDEGIVNREDGQRTHRLHSFRRFF